jgi:hypothetical protein
MEPPDSIWLVFAAVLVERGMTFFIIVLYDDGLESSDYTFSFETNRH